MSRAFQDVALCEETIPRVQTQSTDGEIQIQRGDVAVTALLVAVVDTRAIVLMMHKLYPEVVVARLLSAGYATQVRAIAGQMLYKYHAIKKWG